jgi:chromate transporter
LLLLAGLGLQAGLLTFGGAYTAFPLLRDVATTHTGAGWMSSAQLFDGVALVAILPAPLVTVGAFVGYLGAGLPGALVLVGMIYLPAFGFTLIGHGVMERLVGNPKVHAALDGTAAAAAGLLVGTAIEMATPLIGSDPGSLTKVALAIAAAVILLRVRGKLVVPAVLVAAAAAGLAKWSWMGS